MTEESILALVTHTHVLIVHTYAEQGIYQFTTILAIAKVQKGTRDHVDSIWRSKRSALLYITLFREMKCLGTSSSKWYHIDSVYVKSA
jgi:hypothetical protein